MILQLNYLYTFAFMPNNSYNIQSELLKNLPVGCFIIRPQNIDSDLSTAMDSSSTHTAPANPQQQSQSLSPHSSLLDLLPTATLYLSFKGPPSAAAISTQTVNSSSTCTAVNPADCIKHAIIRRDVDTGPEGTKAGSGFEPGRIAYRCGKGTTYLVQSTCSCCTHSQ